MFKVYALIFWLPAAAAAVALRLCWSEGLLAKPLLALGWFLAALVLQLRTGTFSPPWAVALVLQTLLALYLALRWKLGR